ncbi:class I SAM-dependent methyltransferase [Sorangium sp. So ce429]
MLRPSETTAFGYWGAMAARYDAHIRHVVPNYTELVTRLLDGLPDEAGRIIELGCGSGRLSLELAARYPRASITFVDAAVEMVDLTKVRLAAAHPSSAARFRFIVSRFEDLQFDEGSFDLVISNLSLHHVQDQLSLFRRIRQGLTLNGKIRIGDHFLFANPIEQTIHWAGWLTYCRENCSDAELDELLDHVTAHDRYTTLGEQFTMLLAAGFSAPDCVWRSGFAAVVTADRAPMF